jgi:hypothetical protein
VKDGAGRTAPGREERVVSEKKLNELSLGLEDKKLLSELELDVEAHSSKKVAHEPEGEGIERKKKVADEPEGEGESYSKK